MIRSQALLGIPPHRVACTVGIHDDGGVRTASDRGTVGVVEEIAGMEIPCVPTVDDQGGRPGPEIVDVPMKRVEVGRDGVIGGRVCRGVCELEQPTAKPVLCAA